MGGLVLATPRLNFELDEDLAAREPPEAAPGAERNTVRLMASIGSQAPHHHVFDDLPQLLAPGDLLVVNNTAAMAAALNGTTPDGDPVRLHVSTELPSSLWLVEIRTPTANGTSQPDATDRAGQTITTRGGLTAPLLHRLEGSNRLWIAALTWPRECSLIEHLAAHGRPIRYSYVRRDWPLEAYQTVFGRHPGSAEMPSASRPFADRTVTDLIAAGITLAPLTLHTGVSSLEAHEAPYPERFNVPAATARLVNHTRRSGGRVIAVGTTVVRALESVVDDRGVVHPGAGWTDVIVSPERGAASIDGLLTGWHEPMASHLLMLEAVTTLEALQVAYGEAIESRYRWHEFGDVHLITR